MPEVVWLTRFQFPPAVWTKAIPVGRPVAVAVGAADDVNASLAVVTMAAIGSLYWTLCEAARPSVITGAVLSILHADEVNVALLPALSVTITEPVTPAPSAEMTSGLLAGLVEDTPERLSPV